MKKDINGILNEYASLPMKKENDLSLVGQTETKRRVFTKQVWAIVAVALCFVIGGGVWLGIALGKPNDPTVRYLTSDDYFFEAITHVEFLDDWVDLKSEWLERQDFALKLKDNNEIIGFSSSVSLYSENGIDTVIMRGLKNLYEINDFIEIDSFKNSIESNGKNIMYSIVEDNTSKVYYLSFTENGYTYYLTVNGAVTVTVQELCDYLLK